MIDLSTRRVPKVGDLHGINQLYGLYDMISENFNKETYLCEIGCHSGVSTELFAFMCGKVVGVDHRYLPPLKKIVKKYANLHFIQGKSNEMVSQFEDGELDAVYIDARHEYESVKEDITLWIPKVRKSGIICGHDYMTDEMASKVQENKHHWRKMGNNGVRKAVDEFFDNVRVYKDSSWIVNTTC